MDQKPHMPDIRTEVNREPERKEKKRGAFLLSLLGRALPGGSVLATKSGLLAVALAGTTVAGGIGLVGYKLMGPGESDRAGGNLSLFAPKPKDVADPNALPAAPKDGTSQSLSMAKQANTGSSDSASSASDAGAAGGSSADSASAGASAAEHSAGAVGSMPKGTLGKKFGELSKNLNGGGTAPAANAAGAKPGADATASAGAKGGALGGMNRGRASSVTPGARTIVGRRANSAVTQAFGVRNDNRGATSSFGAGRTYDGATAAGGGTIGAAEGSAIGAGGVGTAAQPTSLPNSAANKKELEAPPTPDSKDVTPWKNSITTAQVILGAAAMLLLVAKMVNKIPGWGTMAARAIGGVVGLLGALVVALGAQIAGGAYGQKLQGGILAAAGAGLILAGARVAFSDVKTSALPSGQAGPPAPGGLSVFNGSGGMFGGVDPMVVLGGGLGLIGLVATMMVPPKQYPSKTFQNGAAPDSHWFG